MASTAVDTRSKSSSPAASSPVDDRSLLRRTSEDIAALSGSPLELWLIFGIKFLESVAYFAITNILVLYLSEELKYSDVEAGKLFGAWATLVTVLTFVSGMVADSLGIRLALLVSVLSCLLGRGLLVLADTRGMALAGMLVSSWGTAAMFPTMVAAVKRYTRTQTVSFAFSFFYVVMNIGAFVAPITIGSLRRVFKTSVTLMVPGLGPVVATSSRLIFAISALTTLLALVLVWRMRPDSLVPAVEPENSLEGQSPPLQPQAPSQGSAQGKTQAMGLDVLADSGFWRFMLFITLLVMVKLIFQHAHQTWPKYTLREFGKDFDFAYCWSINPAMIMLLTPLATALTRNLSAFWCIVVGSFLSAGSVFFMAFSTSVPACILFVVTLSIGEMLWSPRLYEYTAMIAPKGREASYMGLSSVPMFFAKMVVGWLSGTMLATYCPETGVRHSQTMWLYIGVMTLIGPVLIVLLKGVIEGAKDAKGSSAFPR